MEYEKLCDWRGAFFIGIKMCGILSSAKAYKELLNIEYQIILGCNNKSIQFSVSFEEKQFFHLAGFQYLADRATTLFGDRKKLFYMILNEEIKAERLESSLFYPQIKERVEYLAFLEPILDSNKTIFKYNPKIEAFSAIQSEFLLKNVIESRNVFTFLSENKLSGKYFCRSFFPQTDKDYSVGQTNWTLLYKKKIQKSTEQEIVLYDKLKIK